MASPVVSHFYTTRLGVWIPALVFHGIGCCVTHLCVLFLWRHCIIIRLSRTKANRRNNIRQLKSKQKSLKNRFEHIIFSFTSSNSSLSPRVSQQFRFLRRVSDSYVRWPCGTRRIDNDNNTASPLHTILQTGDSP